MLKVVFEIRFCCYTDSFLCPTATMFSQKYYFADCMQVCVYFANFASFQIDPSINTSCLGFMGFNGKILLRS